jgi:hypothetical protein
MNPQTEMDALTFVNPLFNEIYYLDFKCWLGIESVESFKKSIMTETITAEMIKETLAVPQHKFCKKSNA